MFGFIKNLSLSAKVGFGFGLILILASALGALAILIWAALLRSRRSLRMNTSLR